MRARLFFPLLLTLPMLIITCKSAEEIIQKTDGSISGTWAYDVRKNITLPPPHPETGLSNPIFTFTITSDTLFLNWNGRETKHRYELKDSGSLLYLANQSTVNIICFTDSTLAIIGNGFPFPKFRFEPKDTLHFVRQTPYKTP